METHQQVCYYISKAFFLNPLQRMHSKVPTLLVNRGLQQSILNTGDVTPEESPKCAAQCTFSRDLEIRHVLWSSASGCQRRRVEATETDLKRPQ